MENWRTLSQNYHQKLLHNKSSGNYGIVLDVFFFVFFFSFSKQKVDVFVFCLGSQWKSLAKALLLRASNTNVFMEKNEKCLLLYLEIHPV